MCHKRTWGCVTHPEPVIDPYASDVSDGIQFAVGVAAGLTVGIFVDLDIPEWDEGRTSFEFGWLKGDWRTNKSSGKTYYVPPEYWDMW